MIRPVAELDPEIAARIEGVFFDIDDTFSTDGKILPCAFQALWDLRAAGLRTVPITGRPAGWCDHIARMWPVDAVVGENGAFYFWLDEKRKRLKRRYFETAHRRAENQRRLRALEKIIPAAVPGAAVASDQRYREADLAIDFCEDVQALSWPQVERICQLFAAHGAHCKVSSIHVNGWFGDYDKLSMTQIMVRELWGRDLARDRHHFLFCGDSPNDEPMFRFFPVAVGVHNIFKFEERIRHWPAFVTTRPGGAGFAELVSRLLASRSGNGLGGPSSCG